MNISNWVVMTDKKRKQFHLCFKAVCGPKTSNCGKYLILLVTVLFIREKWLHLLMLLKTGVPWKNLRNHCRHVKIQSSFLYQEFTTNH